MANPNPHQLYNIGQKALITYKNEALAVLDAKHGDWTLPGGRIDQNEDPDRAQEREILEETGITLKDHSFVKRLLGREQWDQYKINHDGISLMLLVWQFDFEEKPKIFLSEEHSEYVWITKETIDSIDFVEGQTKSFYEKVLTI